MESFDVSNTRHYISNQYARWCAFSATRSGAPQKSRSVVYPLIDIPEYGDIMQGSTLISEEEFDHWHRINTERICRANTNWTAGWSAKLINIYLKTMVYVGNIGRPGLDSVIHPPIDGGLWTGVLNRYGQIPEIIQQTHVVNTIKNIETYHTYLTIIAGMKQIKNIEGWKLIEVEQLWEGTNY